MFSEQAQIVIHCIQQGNKWMDLYWNKRNRNSEHIHLSIHTSFLMLQRIPHKFEALVKVSLLNILLQNYV